MDSGQPGDNKVHLHDGSLIPATPVKPILPKPPQPPPIYAGTHRNQPRTNLYGSERFYFDSTEEAQTSGGVACYRGANWVGANWESAPAGQFQVAGDNNRTVTSRSLDEASKWDLSFKQLLALADTAICANASDPFNSGSYISEAADCEISNPHRHTFNLNLPSQTENDTASIRITTQFAPVTPDKGKSYGTNTVEEVIKLSTENGSNEKEQNQNRSTSISIYGENLRETQELTEPTSFSITATHEKEGEHAVTPNKTPPQRQRRKKHRPKVIVEGKSRRAEPNSKSLSSNPNRRKRVRKNMPSQTPVTPPVEVTGESLDQQVLTYRRKSSRRALHFDPEIRTSDGSSLYRSINSAPVEQNLRTQNIDSVTGLREARLEQVVGSSIDPNWSMNQMLRRYKYIPEKQDPSFEISANQNSPELRLPSDYQMKNNTEQNATVNSSFRKEIMLKDDPPSSKEGPNCFTFSANSTEREQAPYCKRKHSHDIKRADTGSINLTGAHYNMLNAYQSMSWVYFPNVYKKKRTEKGEKPTTCRVLTDVTAARHFTRSERTCSLNDPYGLIVSKSDSWIARPQFNTCKTAAMHGGRELPIKLQTYRSMMALSQTERATKKRSKATKRICKSAPSARIDCQKQPIYPTNQPPADSSMKILDKSHTCINVLFEHMHAPVVTKKRTKKKFSTNLAYVDTNKVPQLDRSVPSNQFQFSPGTLGTASEEPGYQMHYIDAIVEQLKHLDINKESNDLIYSKQALIPYNIQNQESKAIVIIGRDGTIIPFNPVKKRRTRPKVELDEETNRVWKLLMGNINSQGIDGTDEEKTKWWEEERKVFRGRVDSFIARMHLVQGDRRFSQWKGSVVDSVVGVFLTQNVSDHLSSSAFMSLAARFPPKPKCQQPCYQEACIELDEPKAEDYMKLGKQILHQHIGEQSSLMNHQTHKSEGQKIIGNNEFSGSNTEDRSLNKESDLNFLNSSQNILETCIHSVEEISLIGTRAMQTCCSGEREMHDLYSCQDYLDSSISQTSESIEPSVEGNSEYLTSRSKGAHVDFSSEELVQMAGLNTLKAHDTNVLFIEQSENSNNQIAGKRYVKEIEDTFQPLEHEISMKDSANHLSSYQMHLGHTSEPLDVDCYQTYNEIQTSGVCHNKNEDFQTEQSTLTVESDTRASTEIELEVDIHEASLSSSELCINLKEHSLTSQSQGSEIEDPQIVESPAECTNKVHENPTDFSSNAAGIASQSNRDPSLGKELKEMKAATSKSQRKKFVKDNKTEVKWDHLRKQAATNGKTRQKTENTMDSLDWEAVRCADVDEIAHAIRERGMNNMLAERIKAFLNRLVKDHESIDLEWLRDVAPDQAKEYLLSIGGLGLKSVECVRLLTLHHLAFPVDTNVGRIAVRLGWVPLQPLPESLQLHLLELYPVLESIQKYLWPRLCKLDQRTLYELHYQMITFGKVFCTKSKPNCNACPMRGECRHFASAFASARLSLPAPEDKSIVSTTESRGPDENPARIIDQQLLALPPSTKASEENRPSESSHQSDEKIGIAACVPIIEEPATPEQESTQASINDIEDAFYEDPDEIPTIKLNIEEFSLNLQNYMQKNMEIQEVDMCKALIALTPEAASIPMPKLKNFSRLRTEHQVYELPDYHPLLEMLKLDRREPDDPCSYLLAIWTPGETANSIQPPEKRCSYQECGQLCNEEECFSCNSVKEANSQMVRGTLLIPCRTAMRGSFPLNGTYFQVNEVFADHDSSLNPIDVPRSWIWNLPRRTVYFGTSIPTIFKGLSTEGIQHCFWRGFVCVRGFDQKSRAPRPLMARLHFPASKLNRRRGKTGDQLEEQKPKP